MLVTADDVLLNYIYQGNIGLEDKFFTVEDKDSFPTGVAASLSFFVSSDGEAIPTKNIAQEFFKTADCSGQAYMGASANGVYILFGGGGVDWIRTPIAGVEPTEADVEFESTQNNGVGVADYSCREEINFVPKAGIAVAYDIAPLLNSIKTPLKIVDYVAPAP